MEINNGFNNSPEDKPTPADSSTPEESTSSKKGRTSSGQESVRRQDGSEKRRAEPLGKMIIGEEIVLFEKPKEEDKLQPEKSAEEPNVEVELSEAIEHEATKEIIDQRIPEVQAEIAAADPVEAAPAEADEHFLEAARERLEADPDMPVQQAIDEAYRQTAAEVMQAPAAEVDPPASIESAPPIFTAPEQNEVPALPELPVKPLTPLEAARQAAAQAHEAEAPRDSAFWLDQPTRSMEGAVNPTQAETAPAQPQREVVVKKSSWAALLTGYVIGRKGGRKRTEKQYKPVVERLNKTVKSLQAAVSGREAQIRDLSREQAKVHQTAEQRSREVPTMPLPVMAAREAAPVTTQAKRPEVFQTPPPARPEQVPQGNEAIRPPVTEQMPKTQLLQVAEQIRVEGISVRSMHEVGRFDENSLRRIVHEYLGGNRNVAKVVSEEVEKHDRTRFARFETLNQAAPPVVATPYAPARSDQPTPHGSLPRPMTPGQQQQAVNPSTGRPEAPKQPIGTAEKVVLSTSVFFIVLAAAIITVVLLRN